MLVVGSVKKKKKEVSLNLLDNLSHLLAAFLLPTRPLKIMTFIIKKCIAEKYCNYIFLPITNPIDCFSVFV